MKTVKCYGNLNCFDRGKDIFKQLKDKIYYDAKIDKYHHLVKWEVTEEEYQILYKIYGADVSKKIKLVE